MTRNEILKGIAKKYDRGFSTVKRWAATGLDIGDDDAVARYVQALDLKAVGASAKAALRRRRGAKPKPSQGAVPDVKKALELQSVDPSSEGAAAALKRLQEFEKNSSVRLNAAHAEGDQVVISSATKDHVAIAGALIKFENLVATEARASGELIAKGDMENAIVAIADWIRLAFQAWLSSETPTLVAMKDPHQFVTAARTGFALAVKAGFENSLKSRNPIPEWIAAIFADNYGYGE
jgi:hypothetical protein